MKVAFLDRDGVINKEINYLHKIEDFEYTHKCILGLKKLERLGYKIIIITNQAGIAKGFFSEDDLAKLTQWLLNDLSSQGVNILDHIFCPHHPEGTIKEYSRLCDSRKPGSGMLIRARERHNIDMKSSILIGDKMTDVEAGLTAGVTNCFLVRSGHPIPPHSLPKDRVFSDLHQVSEYLSAE